MQFLVDNQFRSFGGEFGRLVCDSGAVQVRVGGIVLLDYPYGQFSGHGVLFCGMDVKMSDCQILSTPAGSCIVAQWSDPC